MTEFKTMKIRGKEYETVKARKKRFYDKFPDGRIVATLLEADEKHALMKAEVYRTGDDQSNGCVFASGHAMEFKGSGANSTSWLENTEESAVGRALDNAGFASMMSCSYEEIVAAERNKEAIAENVLAAVEGVEGDSILVKIKSASTQADLTALWKTLSDSDKKLHQAEFTHRKGEVS